MRNQWSVSGQTVAVMQLSGADEMGRVERGVPSSRPVHQSCSLYASTRTDALKASGVIEVVVWRRLDHFTCPHRDRRSSLDCANATV